ncbi:hypothetical protein L2K70_17055 [Nocardioides KLBMP 9356]|uniref:ABC transporter permease n=1 Tax=Nocardioides potassii TaxID=2911371 RepID=A0ABS9HGT4_9ACTN|nr:hypothetical protein [Nocardioides potassii]MCF6379323.1 hypothetical protein [Nocardioides potassii]
MTSSGRIRATLRELPRTSRVALVLMLVVPTLTWLVVVWHTRPYSAEQVEADRARVEALPAYVRDVAECQALLGELGAGCGEITFAEYTSITREPLTLESGRSLWAVLGVAAMALAVGARWPSGTGVRDLLASAARVLVLGSVASLAISAVWWWGLEWIAERRDLADTEGPGGVSLRASVLVGLSGVMGVAVPQLVRGGLMRFVAVPLACTGLGLVLLLARPVAPWLPPLNVHALLVGGADYAIPPDQVVCTPPGPDRSVFTTWFGSSSTGEYCPPAERTRTTGEALLYLTVTTLVLTAAAVLTRVRRRPAADATRA